MRKNENQSNLEIVDFVKQVSEAMTIMAEGIKQGNEINGSIKELINAQNVATATAFKGLDGKMDGLMTMFKYVIVPLITGIVGLVGAKMLFHL